MRIAPILRILALLLPAVGAFGQDDPAGYSIRAQTGRLKDLSVAAGAAESQERAGLLAVYARMTKILSKGGAVAPADKPFLNQWFPSFMANGLIGRPPTEKERDRYFAGFGNLLKADDWRITGECARAPNCIAWSVGDAAESLWPDEGTEREFDAFYERRGLVPLKAGESADAADVALWSEGGKPTHACRRLAKDWWESKLGQGPRIAHRLEELEDSPYGKPLKFYRWNGT